MSRVIHVSRQWTRTLRIEQNDSHEAAVQGKLGIGSSGVQLDLKKLIQSNYGLEENTTETLTEEITLTVPAGIRTELHLDWKRLWQHGVVKEKHSDSASNAIEFRVAVGLTFDQTQTDQIG